MASIVANQHSEQWRQMRVELAAGERDAKSTELDCADVLAELYGLLEDYAPPWYTEQLHERTEKVLRRLGRL